ncbi:MAG: hypothetical protein ACR2OU_02225 [Thermomicrobiales bacterium]
MLRSIVNKTQLGGYRLPAVIERAELREGPSVCRPHSDHPDGDWTRSGDRIGGSVFFDVEWTAPITRMREELVRILNAMPLWDGRSGSLTVADAAGGYNKIRVGLSARDNDTLFELKSHVRECMIAFLVEHGQSGLPRYRVEHFPTVPILSPIGPVEDAGIRRQQS